MDTAQSGQMTEACVHARHFALRGEDKLESSLGGPSSPTGEKAQIRCPTGHNQRHLPK
jgi:hypothetical protein